jgi:hypothetical protein
MKRREKCPSVNTREMKHRVATELYLFPGEKENIDKTLKDGKEWSSQPFPGFGSRLCKGKILAPLTSVVLNGNLLVSLGLKVFLICLHVFRQLLKYLQKEKKLVSYYCA